MADTFRIYKKDGTKVSEGPSPAVIDDMTVGQKAADGDYYAVQVVSPTEESAKAPIPSFMAMDIPGAPTVTLTAKDAAIDFAIVAPEDDGAPSSGSSDITEYDVYLKSRSDNWPDQPTQTVTPDKLTGTLDGLTNGTEYTVGVIAVNAAGTSDLNAEGASDHATPVAATVAVTGVTLDQGTLSVKVGATGQLAATLAPANATDKAVNWSSSDETVATVDNTGKVTGVKVGTATITAAAHADGTKKATSEVTVTA